MAPNEPSANGGGTAAAVAARPQRPTTATWPAARRSAAPTAPRRRFSDSIADYAYVPADLRRIGLLAGGLVIFMVALSFVIR